MQVHLRISQSLELLVDALAVFTVEEAVSEPDAFPSPEEEDEEAGEASDLSPAMFFFLSPLLKSVSYQPPPLSRKPAAETSLLNSG